jgi:hypothetical protein
VKAWDRFWFAPAPALDLAAARVVVALQALWIVLSRDIPSLSALPAAFWADVTASARWRYLLWEGHPALERTLQALALAALLGVLLGVRARVCCAAAALLLYHLAPLETLFYTPSPWAKGLTLPVVALVVLALAPCADALALERRRATREGWEYGWALRLVQLLVATPYLFSGWSKLLNAGLGWASSANMRAWLLLSNLDDQLAVFHRPGLWLADRPALCLALGVAGLLFDLAFVAAVFSRRARGVLVPLAVLFHAGIVVTQNYAFLSAPLLLVYADWSALARRWRRAAPPRALPRAVGQS